MEMSVGFIIWREGQTYMERALLLIFTTDNIMMFVRIYQASTIGFCMSNACIAKALSALCFVKVSLGNVPLYNSPVVNTLHVFRER